MLMSSFLTKIVSHGWVCGVEKGVTWGKGEARLFVKNVAVTFQQAAWKWTCSMDCWLGIIELF